MKYSMLLGILVLVSIAGAELDTVTMGPYEVSFDMGDIEYELGSVVVAEDSGCTIYQVPLTTFVGVGEPSYSHKMLANVSHAAIIPRHSMIEVAHTTIAIIACPTWGYASFEKAYGSSTVVSIREVDNRNVTVIESSDGGFIVDYFLESQGWYGGVSYGKTIIKIWSGADWDTMRQFLNTVHVECMSE